MSANSAELNPSQPISINLNRTKLVLNALSRVLRYARATSQDCWEDEMKRLQTQLDAEPTAAERQGERRAELGITGWMARKLFGEDAEPETDSAHHAPAGQATSPATLAAQPATPSTHQEATEAAETTPGIKALCRQRRGQSGKRSPSIILSCGHHLVFSPI